MMHQHCKQEDLTCEDYCETKFRIYQNKEFFRKFYIWHYAPYYFIDCENNTLQTIAKIKNRLTEKKCIIKIDQILFDLKTIWFEVL